MVVIEMHYLLLWFVLNTLTNPKGALTMKIELNHVHEMRNGVIKVETYSLTYKETNKVTFVTRMVNNSLDSKNNQTNGLTYHYSSLGEATDKFDFLVRRFIDPTHLDTSEEASNNGD